MIWVMSVLAVLFFLDALRSRARVSALTVLPIEAPAATGAQVLALPGVTVPDGTRDAAMAWARGRSLQAVDLIPPDLPTFEALALVQLVDPRTEVTTRLARGVSAGYALVIEPALAERAALDPPATYDQQQKAARRAKLYAPLGFAHAIAPGLTADREAPLPHAPALVLGIQGVVYALLILGVALPGVWPYGLAALGVFHLQPVIATVGTALRPRDLALFAALRLPIELVTWARSVFMPRPDEGPDPVDERRPIYAELLSEGTDRFFEPRRTECSFCGGANLDVHLRTTDLLQHKPGTFVLERCADCDHIFQNPRLTIDGLGFYYRDAYDGLGEEHMDLIFGHSDQPYTARARMVEATGAVPERWLDVGGGHGHFCCVAREVFPNTTFDCLDLSESVEEAARRGWADTGFRGLFPDEAPGLAGQYDVVSMSHYLEHTTEPEAEIEAAAVALTDGGRLLIEVPDPQSPLGRILGRWWIPWFQPQHLNLLSTTNLTTVLRRHGFEPEVWHRGEAHQRVDIVFAIMLMMHRLAGGRTPWGPPMTALGRVRQAAAFTLGMPFVLFGLLLDRIFDPLIRRAGWSNTYRVLARKTGAPS